MEYYNLFKTLVYIYNYKLRFNYNTLQKYMNNFRFSLLTKQELTYPAKKSNVNILSTFIMVKYYITLFTLFESVLYSVVLFFK